MDMDAAYRLLRDTVEEHGLAAGEVVVLEGGDGGLAQDVAAMGAGAVTTFTRDARLLKAAQRRTGVTVSDAVRQSGRGTADLVLLPVPKGRAYARSLLLTAWEAVRPGGKLLVCGQSTGGAKGVIADAKAVFGNAEVLGYKWRQRVAVSVKQADEVDTTQKQLRKWWGVDGIMPGTRAGFEVQEAGEALRFETTAGVFSWEHLDPGTALLLERLTIQPGETVHDVGCGAGVIGVVAAKRGAGRVVMTDVDLLAAEATRWNVEANDVQGGCEVRAEAGLIAEAGSVDLVVSNPAFHRGEEVDYEMAEALAQQAGAALAPGGRLVVVANRFLAYHKLLKRYFEAVERVYEDTKFHVLEARQPVKGEPEPGR